MRAGALPAFTLSRAQNLSSRDLRRFLIFFGGAAAGRAAQRQAPRRQRAVRAGDKYGGRAVGAADHADIRAGGLPPRAASLYASFLPYGPAPSPCGRAQKSPRRAAGAFADRRGQTTGLPSSGTLAPQRNTIRTIAPTSGIRLSRISAGWRPASRRRRMVRAMPGISAARL